MRDFGLIWLGQSVSLLGSGLSLFALGVFVFQRSGSVTEFALLGLSAALPATLLSPLAGVAVDRWERRFTLMLNDAGCALTVAAVAGLLAAGQARVWHVYVAMALLSVLNTLQVPALAAATTLLVPAARLERANGLMQAAQSAAQTVAPLAAGALVASAGVAGALWCDAASYLFSLGTLLVARIPVPPPSAEGRAAAASPWSELTFGWRFHAARPGLLVLLLYFAVMSLVVALSNVLVVPLLLSFASPRALGTVLSAAGAGMLAGALGAAAWGARGRRVSWLMSLGVLASLSLAGAGLRASAGWVGAALAVFLCAGALVNAGSQAVWQLATPPDVQGRVFAARRMCVRLAVPVAYVAGGVLADRVFEPLMAPGGPLAGTVGAVIGTGPGRGVGLLFVVLGGVGVLASGLAWSSRALRRLDALVREPAPAERAGPASARVVTA